MRICRDLILMDFDQHRINENSIAPPYERGHAQAKVSLGSAQRSQRFRDCFNFIFFHQLF
jgi:hypothetical protein